MIFGTAYDETLGDPLRVTVIATGLNSSRKPEARCQQWVDGVAIKASSTMAVIPSAGPSLQ